MSSPIITFKDVTVRYGSTVALHAVCGTIREGSLTAIAGPNGAGKSTLLKAICGIVRPSSGSVTIDAEAKKRLAYLPQVLSIQRDFPITVLEMATVGFWPKLGNAGGITQAYREKARAALRAVGIAELEARQIGTLSGGQFQRLLFARVMLQDARVILLDEPFAAVDAATVEKLMQIMLRWHEEGRTVVCVLHDLMLIKKYFPDSFVLASKCLGSGHTHDLFEQKLLSFDLDMAELCPGGDEKGEHHHVHA